MIGTETNLITIMRTVSEIIPQVIGAVKATQRTLPIFVSKAKPKL